MKVAIREQGGGLQKGGGGALALGRHKGPSLSWLPTATPPCLEGSNQQASSWASSYPLWAEGFSRSLSFQLNGAGMTGNLRPVRTPVPATTPHCGVILAASARIRAMRSWLIRKTNRRLAICMEEKGGSEQRWEQGQAHRPAHHTPSETP